MPDDFAHHPSDELDVLLSMSTPLRAGQRIDAGEVERALEAGFGSLIALEAQLSRLQAKARTGPDVDEPEMGALKNRIEALRDALADLRTLSTPPGEARIGYGFVLPGQHDRPHAQHN